MRKNLKQAVWITAASLVVLTAGGCSGSNETVPVETSQEATAETEATTAETEANTADETITETEAPSGQSVSEATDADYLKTYFDVEVTGAGPDAESFSKYLQQVAGGDAPVISGELSWISAVTAAVSAAEFDELMLSYPKEKTAARLTSYGLAEGDDEISDAALAVALDTGLIDKESGKRAAAGDTFTASDAERLLMAVAEANGDARNYLGMSSDPSIYGKVDNAWNSFIIFDDGQLSEVGKNAVQQQISTGYGIKSDAYNARFLPDLTLQYGHSDIKHAHQLLGLLSSENIEAKVQLEPKISIYEYLLEWGPIPEATPTYEVKQFGDDLYLVYAVEYDMQLEFNTTEDMLRFDQVIQDYAKKNEGNEEAVGLIYGSWWQPLYSTTRTDMPDGYEQMFDCVVTNGIYSIHPFSIPENKDETVAKLKELAGGDLTVEAKERFCNTAFYNYLTGEDYQ